MSESTPTHWRRCPGPVYYGDQGIEVCETCGGCICCDFETVDHSKAERRWLTNRNGRCVLKAHAGRACQSAAAA